ncbi:hypothetical protein [Aquincola sp. J276]|uniref:hypothetical protein n=1 Tax=Aquincola sp. J276 TaxID=2898432 RepID=UPI002150FABF|nr:hypothetical protein [Aquincola sp. J276]MCR5869227.1 hypothetical protein [Aquincola sp. J276]
MPRLNLSLPLPASYLALAAAYLLASLGHFTHNAEFICSYPNLPAWLTSAQVYGFWLALTAVGVLGLALVRAGRKSLGLLVIGAYAALGFDGLGHYALAPMALHTLVANITILSEVAAAALLLAATAALLVRHLRAQWRAVYGG